MNRFSMAKLLVVLAMLLSIVTGPAAAMVSISGPCPAASTPALKAHCCTMPCCAARSKNAPEEKPAPVPQRTGQELAATLASAPFSLLFTLAPTEPRPVSVSAISAAHSPEPLRAGCILVI
jgi:hypothetical protein